MATKPPGDFYAPYYRIRFFRSKPTKASDQNNKKLDPTSDPAPVLELTSAQEDLDLILSTYDDAPTTRLRGYVSSVIIDGVSSDAFKAVVTLTPPYEDAVKLLEAGLIVFDSIMEIQWGYFVGDEPIVSPKHLFRITEPSARFGSTTTITVLGRDIFSASAIERCESRSWDRASFPRDLDVLFGIRDAMTSDMSIDASALPPTSQLLQRGTGPGWEQRDTYWRFFRVVCGSGTGWTVVGDTVKLYDRRAAARAATSYRLVWRANPTGRFDIPIKEISINPLLTLFQGLPEAMGIRQSKSNNDTGGTSQRDVSDANLPKRVAVGASRLTAASPTARVRSATKTSDTTIKGSPSLGTNQTGDHRITTDRTPNADSRVDDDTLRAAQSVNNLGTAIIPGHPLIEPQMVVSLVGLPRPFADRWLIMSVKHSLGSSYTVELSLMAQSSSADPRGDGASAQGEIQPSTAVVGRDPTGPVFDGNGRPTRAGGGAA